MNIFLAILLMIISYLLGSVPNALIISKLTKGIDIRDYGSKNMGATNTLRVLGLKWGILVLFLDALKAALIVALVNINAFGIKSQVFHPLLYGAIAVIGHLFPIYCKFKGGKGVASACGVMFGFNPLCGLICFIAFFIALFITKYVSLSSLTASITSVIYTLVLLIIEQNIDNILLFSIFTCIFILLLIKHIPNIKRVIAGTETKITDMINKKK